MGRKKAIRLTEIQQKDNVLVPEKRLLERTENSYNQDFFNNENPIVLELGCGKGEYTVGLASRFADKNFVGIDVKGERIWVGSTLADEKKLSNVAFIRTEIQWLENFFAPQQISEIWIPFPDPQPKDRNEKHRLTHVKYLNLYKKILIPNGIVHLKTDSQTLFEYTLAVLKVPGFENIAVEDLEKSPKTKDLQFTFDLYQSDLQAFHQGIQTRFESKFLARKQAIHYLQFRFEAG
jgi:tRNA (guanine-N7-)-methyltransferase